MDLHISQTTSYFLAVIYMILLVFTIVRILLDTDSTAKTLAYLLITLVFPIIGMLFYFALGINYRRSKSTKKIAQYNVDITDQMKNHFQDKTDYYLKQDNSVPERYASLVRFLHQLGVENPTENAYQLFVNGEEKFPEVLISLKDAQHHIHMEYYG